MNFKRTVHSQYVYNLRNIVLDGVRTEKRETEIVIKIV